MRLLDENTYSFNYTDLAAIGMGDVASQAKLNTLTMIICNVQDNMYPEDVMQAALDDYAHTKAEEETEASVESAGDTPPESKPVVDEAHGEDDITKASHEGKEPKHHRRGSLKTHAYRRHLYPQATRIPDFQTSSEDEARALKANAGSV